MDLEKIRQDFPMLEEKKGRRAITYFDNACQSLRPRAVLLPRVLGLRRPQHAQVVRGGGPRLRQGPHGGCRIPQCLQKRGDNLYAQHHRGDQPGGKLPRSAGK